MSVFIICICIILIGVLVFPGWFFVFVEYWIRRRLDVVVVVIGGRRSRCGWFFDPPICVIFVIILVLFDVITSIINPAPTKQLVIHCFVDLGISSSSSSSRSRCR